MSVHVSCSPGRVQGIYNCRRVVLAAAWNVHRHFEEARKRFQGRLWPDALDLLRVPAAPHELPYVESRISESASRLQVGKYEVAVVQVRDYTYTAVSAHVGAMA
jgi:hypothetical protein